VEVEFVLEIDIEIILRGGLLVIFVGQAEGKPVAVEPLVLVYFRFAVNLQMQIVLTVVYLCESDCTFENYGPISLVRIYLRHCNLCLYN
jgi:hypothetical protein